MVTNWKKYMNNIKEDMIWIKRLMKLREKNEKKFDRTILILTILTVTLCLGAVLLFFIIAGRSRIIQNKVKKIMKNYNVDTEVVIDMSDLTDFEWEQCIVYSAGTQTKDIQDAFHVNYNTVLDINSGIIFVSNNEVVYEEFIDDAVYFDTIPPFNIFPTGLNDDSRIKYAGFEKDEAKFICIKKDYNGKGHYYYRLYPVD